MDLEELNRSLRIANIYEHNAVESARLSNAERLMLMLIIKNDLSHVSISDMTKQAEAARIPIGSDYIGRLLNKLKHKGYLTRKLHKKKNIYNLMEYLR